MISLRRNVLILYHGGHHQSLTIFQDYIQGIVSVYPNARLLDYFHYYLHWGIRGASSGILEEVVRHKCDLLYFLPGSGDMTLPAKLFEELSGVVCIVMNFFDSELFFDSVDRHYAQAADLVLIPNPATEGLFTSIGIKAYCTFSLFDPIRYPCKKLERTIDFSFVGNLAKAGRRTFIDALQRGGFNVAVFGYGSRAGIVGHEKMVNLFNSTKINLNFSRAEDSFLLLHAGQGVMPPRQLKGRVTEIALTGGFVLTEYAPGLEDMYEIGKEIDTFHDLAELVQKCRYYLTHDSERNAIAAAGRLRALRDYDCRTAFLTVSRSLPWQSRVRQIHYDQAYVHNQANFLFYYFFRFALSLRFAKAFFEIHHIHLVARVDVGQASRLGLRAFSACWRKNTFLAWLCDLLRQAIDLRLNNMVKRDQ